MQDSQGKSCRSTGQPTTNNSAPPKPQLLFFLVEKAQLPRNLQNASLKSVIPDLGLSRLPSSPLSSSSSSTSGRNISHRNYKTYLSSHSCYHSNAKSISKQYAHHIRTTEAKKSLCCTKNKNPVYYAGILLIVLLYMGILLTVLLYMSSQIQD